MKEKNDTFDYHTEDAFENLYEGSAGSASDMTGLIPALPEDEEELEAYQELYPYLPDGR